MLGQTAEELNILKSVESILGDLTTDNLSTAIGRFFNSLRELASQPESTALREQALSAADSLAVQFRSIADALRNLDTGIEVEARNVIDQANSLATEVADLNRQAALLFYRGTPDNNLLDRRDQAVRELAGLMDIQVQRNSDDTVNLTSGGTAIVVRSKATALEVGYTSDGELGVSVAGANYFSTQVAGGRLGGLLAAKNELLPGIRGAIDGLAQEIITRVNRVHVQGLGATGSFTRLSGGVMDEDLSTWEPPLEAGTVFVRITDTSTGQVRREAMAVDPAADTLSDVAARFSGLTGLTASVAGGRLNIEADDGYQFDFLPVLLRDPQTSNLTGSSQPTVSGVYTGDETQTFTACVVGTGQVGVTEGLSIRVTDGAGNIVVNVDVGQGYAAGDSLVLADGVRVALSTGTLANGETFTIQALASSDTSGFLAAAGLNTFFAGNSAQSMVVAQDVRDDSGRLATYLGVDGTDNLNVRRMADVGDARIESLGNVTIGDGYRLLATNVGRQITVREARQEGLERAAQQLMVQRDAVSGVDINDEAARLLMFEQLFQGMAKYLSVVDRTTQYLLDVM
jgi:flagellar hook-associated protein 1 FlgK